MDQITGRCHHRGQTRDVTAFHIVAMGTTDVMMSSMAKTKGEMLQGFVAKEPGLLRVIIRYILLIYTGQKT